MKKTISRSKFHQLVRETLEAISPSYNFEQHLVDDIRAALMILTDDESALSNREGYYEWDAKLSRAIGDLNSVADMIERKRERGR
jgi:hypothetical protein